MQSNLQPKREHKYSHSLLSNIQLSEDDKTDEFIQTRLSASIMYQKQGQHEFERKYSVNHMDLIDQSKTCDMFQISTSAPENTSTFEIIDLCTPVKSNSITSITLRLSPEYIPKTLNIHNQNRLCILPMFPKTIDDDISNLLLVNVPSSSLSIEQLNRRLQEQNNDYRPKCIEQLENTSTPSCLREYVFRNYKQLIKRFNINWKLLDFNYSRFDHCFKLFANERIRRLRQSPYEVRLLDDERVVAMEFYLQFDVDLFYMKTFSGRNVQPSERNNSLFCTSEPEYRFKMKQCSNYKCPVCSYSKRSSTDLQSCVNFNENGTYQFLNGYTAILNAPVTCYTNGIVYVLKCPCGKYEYVGETSNNIHYTLDRHRTNGYRIIHNFLIGEQRRFEFINNNSMNPNYNEINGNSSSHLYQHSPRCQIVIQMFLDYYPHYWIFVPIHTSQIRQQHNTLNTHRHGLVAENRRHVPISVTHGIRNDSEIRQCLQCVPLPPAGFQFTNEQLDAQAQYFKYGEDRHLPDKPFNLYNASIITVLPEKTSQVFRQFIASLFITHAETKLNSIGNLLEDTYSKRSSSHGFLRGNWCESLVTHPLLVTSSTSSSSTLTTSSVSTGTPTKRTKIESPVFKQRQR